MSETHSSDQKAAQRGAFTHSLIYSLNICWAPGWARQTQHRGWWPVLLERLPHSEELHLVYCFAVVILKFLIILWLNMCFVSEVQQNNRACTWAEERHTASVSASFLTAPSPYSIRDAHGYRIAADPHWVRVQRASKEVPGKHLTSGIKHAGVPTAPRGHIFKPELSNKHRWSRHLIIYFLSFVSLKMMI